MDTYTIIAYKPSNIRYSQQYCEQIATDSDLIVNYYLNANLPAVIDFMCHRMVEDRFADKDDYEYEFTMLVNGIPNLSLQASAIDIARKKSLPIIAQRKAEKEEEHRLWLQQDKEYTRQKQLQEFNRLKQELGL